MFWSKLKQNNWRYNEHNPGGALELESDEGVPPRKMTNIL